VKITHDHEVVFSYIHIIIMAVKMKTH